MPMNYLPSFCFILCAKLLVGVGNLSSLYFRILCFILLFFVFIFFNECSSLQIFENHLNLETTWHVNWICQYFFRPVARVISPSLPNNVDFESDNTTNYVWSIFIECNCPQIGTLGGLEECL